MTQAPAPASSPRARTVRRPRALIAVLCAQLLLSACHATGVSPIGAVWPEPTRAVPNFQAPSATHCARPIQTREVPGRDPQQPASNPMRGHLAESRMERLSEAHCEYLRFRERTQVAHRARDVWERYLLQVRNARGTVMPDAEVAVTAPGGATLWARTDAGGRAWLHPDAVDTTHSAIYEVAVRKDGRQSSAFLRRGQKSAVDVVLADSAAPARARLDLVFLVDATGSMADEIDRLKTTLRSIANEVAQLPSRPDTCFGLVAYRDKGDEFLLRSHDFTNDLGAFQGVLNALQANGGGDYPEAMNEALHETVHRLRWRGSGATRMVVLLADAPPHLEDGSPQYDDDMRAALARASRSSAWARADSTSRARSCSGRWRSTPAGASSSSPTRTPNALRAAPAARPCTT